MSGRFMLFASAMAYCLALTAPVYAQGVLPGAKNGAEQGNDAAGPVGGVVGGAVGAVTGGINGLIGIKERPRFKQYVIEQHPQVFHYKKPVAVGAVLPAEGVQYYAVPAEYGHVTYQYADVNGEVVLVEPSTRRIVQIIQ
ncbi:hypothetical protein GCM10007874_39720 [Labrys miyagiensis]|uniref:DUF1236 domain-containing protein n=1 Tax=Labrys miyagiensis TaxID=346912 RepID=A0ABQ6CM94_9HYPH|nr:DUF1236 domain-containing protein [Labrys miyagiensis]GLS20955.1 hypothetical protein GCM10007874_39720 [Labrys miyagiensis]